jgi:hypothetical protein
MSLNIAVKGGTSAGKRRPKPTKCYGCGKETAGRCTECYP